MERDRVPARLPPAVGEYAGWKWDQFYDAIISILRNTSNPDVRDEAIKAVRALPPMMIFTESILNAGLARFCRLFPLYESRQVLKYMRRLLQYTGRMKDGNGVSWYQIEDRWQELETEKPIEKQEPTGAGFIIPPMIPDMPAKRRRYRMEIQRAMRLSARQVQVRADKLSRKIDDLKRKRRKTGEQEAVLRALRILYRYRISESIHTSHNRPAVYRQKPSSGSWF